MAINVVGGVYWEHCAWPEHNTLLGSAGRAAQCLAQIDPSSEIRLHARIAARDLDSLRATFAFNRNCELIVSECPTTTKFSYLHPLSQPWVTPGLPSDSLPTLDFSGIELDATVVFGMIEALASVNSRVAIYDPQNTYVPKLFSETGSTAGELVYITNSGELSHFYTRSGSAPDSIEVMSDWLLREEAAFAVVVKCGQRGVYVHYSDQKRWAPPYWTDKVFPVGSGDAFVAAFTHYWLRKQLSIYDAANKASIATAYYVSHGIMNNDEGLEIFGRDAKPLEGEPKNNRIYLAGPFFTLSELWMINEAKRHISSFGMDVFSPYHELGIGTAEDVVQQDIDAIGECDALYAIFNGADPGTLFEIGYARSLDKPVIILAENPKSEELKMYEGSGCQIYSDFASSIYHLAWLGRC